MSFADKVVLVGLIGLAGCLLWAMWAKYTEGKKKPAPAAIEFEARRGRRAAVIAEAHRFPHVWQVSGLDRGIWYALLYAYSPADNASCIIASTADFDEAMAELRAANIAVHNGPPGTVG